MGIVYRAADLTRDGQEVALKLLSTHKIREPRNEARFWREAQTAAALAHPNIGTVYEVGEHAGHLFLAMPLYDGQTLARRLDRAAELEPMPIPEIVSIAAQLAAALAAAHRAGIVHRDVKPANLMLLRGEEAKLLDFGLACWEGAAPLTDLGSAVGTIVYMAPEQIRGEPGGPRADLWSFGAVVYEMLAGRPPFGRSGPQPVQWLMMAILEQEPPPLREMRPDVPPALADIVERCLAKDPADRYGSAEEILSDLRESGLVRAPEAPARQRRLPWRAIAAAATALLIFSAVFSWLRSTRTILVAVPRPEIEGPLSPAERDRIADSLQQATRRALSGLPRLRTVSTHKTAETDEVVTTRAYCGEQICQVVLHRLRGDDGSDLWMDSLEIPVASLDSIALPRLRKAYSR
jgi:serine/threonine-protein kinase